jgi:hypothetical protein
MDRKEQLDHLASLSPEAAAAWKRANAPDEDDSPEVDDLSDAMLADEQIIKDADAMLKTDLIAKDESAANAMRTIRKDASERLRRRQAKALLKTNGRAAQAWAETRVGAGGR